MLPLNKGRHQALKLLFQILALFSLCVLPASAYDKKIPNVPWKSQKISELTSWDHNYNCGPTTVLMLASFWKAPLYKGTNPPTDQDIKDFNQWLAKNIAGYQINGYRGSTTGTDILVKLAHDYYGFTDVAQHNSTIQNLQNELNQGYPVIVGVWTYMSVGFRTVAVNGTVKKILTERHFMVLTGMDDNFVYVNDPGRTAEADGRTKYTLDAFKTAWGNQGNAAVTIHPINVGPTNTVSTTATVDGQLWQGAVNYNLASPAGTITGSAVPTTFTNQPAGAYTINFLGGGPPNSHLTGISPSNPQTLVGNGNLNFILQFATVAPGNGWRMERFNPARTNVTPAKGPQTQPQFNVIVSNVSSQLLRISDDGDLIFRENDRVISYIANGQLRWSKSLGTPVYDVALASDGTVYASVTNSVFALDKNSGNFKWPNAYVANNGNESSPMAIGPDGTIYFLSGASYVGYDPPNVTAINPDGTKKFKSTPDFGSGRGDGGLVLNNDASVIYASSYPQNVISLNATTGAEITNSNKCFFHGVFEFTPSNTGLSYDGDSKLIEFDQSLSTCTQIPIGNSLLAFLALNPSNNIVLEVYTGASVVKGPFAAIDHQGKRIWTSTEFYKGSIIDGNGILFTIAPDTNDVVAINSENGVVIWRSHFTDPINTLLLGGNGKLYVSAGGNLYRG